MRVFLSTPSARRATGQNRFQYCSSPAFLSTPSARRATLQHILYIRIELNFYPRPPRGGRLIRLYFQQRQLLFLSTPSARRATCTAWKIGRRMRIFLSTPSARRATLAGMAGGAEMTNFYPRPPRGGRRERKSKVGGKSAISIHALREEGDTLLYEGRKMVKTFLSTPSARRATHPAT